MALNLMNGDSTELYRQLPEEEQKNMLRIFSIRLKELDELYEKYMKGRIRSQDD